MKNKKYIVLIICLALAFLLLPRNAVFAAGGVVPGSSLSGGTGGAGCSAPWNTCFGFAWQEYEVLRDFSEAKQGNEVGIHFGRGPGVEQKVRNPYCKKGQKLYNYGFEIYKMPGANNWSYNPTSESSNGTGYQIGTVLSNSFNKAYNNGNGPFPTAKGAITVGNLNQIPGVDGSWKEFAVSSISGEYWERAFVSDSGGDYIRPIKYVTYDEVRKKYAQAQEQAIRTGVEFIGGNTQFDKVGSFCFSSSSYLANSGVSNGTWDSTGKIYKEEATKTVKVARNVQVGKPVRFYFKH